MRISLKKGGAAGPDAESGVALILVAFLLLAAGAFLTLGLGIFQTKDTPDLESETRERAERLVDHLASFAQINGRIPCPADPAEDRTTAAFGREDRGGPGQDCDTDYGLFPFMSLGLQERDARDAWGRFFTYAPSPVFVNLDGIQDEGPTRVHDLCRILDVWVDSTQFRQVGGGNLPEVNRNLNPRKAKFCCPANGGGYRNPNTDIQILRATGGAAVPEANLVRNIVDSGNMDIAINVSAAPNTSPEGVAFALVSHGENGLGAYAVDGTNNRIPGAAAGSDEAENQDEDRNFVLRPRVFVNGAGYYDDIVLFRSNFTLISELNVGTCLGPFR